jgi:hypothetical protein
MTLIEPVHHWTCPNCSLEQVTHEPRPHTRFHACPGLHGLTAPMLPAGSEARVTAVEREDYLGIEQTGRYSAVRTDYPDGRNDIAAFAPVATAEGRS